MNPPATKSRKASFLTKFLALSLGLAVVGFSPFAQGQTTRVWNGNTSSSLSTTTNWTPNGTPITDDTLNFNGTDTTTSGANALSMDAVIGGGTGLATVNVTQSNALDFTATSTSNGMRLDSAGTFTIGAGAGQVTFGSNARLILGQGSSTTQSFTLNNNSSNAVIIASNANGNWMGGSGTRNVTFGGSGDWTFNVGLAPASGNTWNVTKSGAGILTLNAAGANLTSFTIANGGGTIAITNGSALGSATLNVGQTGATNASARFQLSNNITVTNTVNIVGQSQSTTATDARIENVSGNNTISGPINFNGTGGNFANIISTAGTLTLGGNLTAVTVTSSRTFAFSGAGNIISNGVISNGSATVGVSKDGAGTLTLTGANTYTGATTVSAGTLKVDNDGTTTFGKITGSSAANSIQVNNGGTLLLSGGGTRDRIGNSAGTTLNGGTLAIAGNSQEGVAATLKSVSNGGSGSPVGTSSVGLGALTLSANSTIDFDSASNGNVMVFANGSNLSTFTLTINNWTNANFDGTQNSGQAGDDRLVFNQDMTSFLPQIVFSGGGQAQQIQLDNGYYEVGAITAVPEPTTIFGALALVGLVGYRERRRITACKGLLLTLRWRQTAG